MGYAGVDPTQGTAVAIRQLEEQVDACPGLRGLKLYPAAVDPLRSFRFDDEDLFPLFVRAQKLGLRVVAVHKALPLGPVPLAAYHVHDVDTAAYHFPDLNFEIVHAEMAFVEETAIAMAQFPQRLREHRDHDRLAVRARWPEGHVPRGARDVSGVGRRRKDRVLDDRDGDPPAARRPQLL